MKRALALLAAAAAAVAGGGWLLAVTWRLDYGHGLYCSLATASTVGCDSAPASPAGRVAAVAVILTAIPLLAAAFGQLHLDKVRLHVDRRLAEHHRKLSGQIGAATVPATPRWRRAAFALVLAAMAVLLVVRAVRGVLRG